MTADDLIVSGVLLYCAFTTIRDVIRIWMLTSTKSLFDEATSIINNPDKYL